MTRIARYGVFALLLFVPLAIGTVHLWSAALASGLAVFILLLAVIYRVIISRHRFYIPFVGWVLIGATIYIAIQLLPLPSGVLKTISPNAHDLFSHVLGKVGLYGDGSWRALTLDQPATALELIKFIGYTALFLALAAFSFGKKRGEQILYWLVLLGALVAVIGLVHKLLNLSSIYGVYESTALSGKFFTSTFVNKNHQAAFTTFAGLIGIGLLFDLKRDRTKRIVLLVSIGLCVMATLMSFSRGGIASFFVGLILFGLLQRTSQKRVRQYILVICILLFAGGMAMWVGAEKFVKRFSPKALKVEVTGKGKVRWWKDSLSMMRDYPLTGIGRGAFARSYTKYKTTRENETVTHPENEYIQVMVEWGLPVGLLFLGSLIGVWIWRLRKGLAARHRGLAVGIFALAVHNMVDFNLEVGGIAFPFVVGMAILYQQEGRHQKFGKVKGAYILTGFLLFAALALSLAIPFAHRHDINKGSSLLKKSMLDKEDKDGFNKKVLQVIRRHPADYFTCFLAAQHFSRRGSWDPVKALYWINRAMFLNPSAYEPHFLAGHLLSRIKKKRQALIEYRASILRNERVRERIYHKIVREFYNFKAFDEITPSLAERNKFLKFLGKHYFGTFTRRYCQWVLRQDRNNRAALELLGRIAISEGRTEEAVEIATRLMDMGAKGLGNKFLGQIHEVQREYQKAHDYYEKSLKMNSTTRDIYFRLAWMKIRLGKLGEARQVIRGLMRIDMSRSTRIKISYLLGRSWEIGKNYIRALREYHRGISLEPYSRSIRLGMARIYELINEKPRAIRMYQILLKRHEDGEVRKKLEACKKELMRSPSMGYHEVAP